MLFTVLSLPQGPVGLQMYFGIDWRNYEENDAHDGALDRAPRFSTLFGTGTGRRPSWCDRSLQGWDVYKRGQQIWRLQGPSGSQNLVCSSRCALIDDPESSTSSGSCRELGTGSRADPGSGTSKEISE